MSKRRWLALAVTFLGVLALAVPQNGVGQTDPTKSTKDKDSKNSKDGPNGQKEGPGLGPPQPGVILPPHVLEFLRFTEEQKKALSDLQKEVDAKLAKILTDEQKKLIQKLKDEGPGAFGPKKDKN